ncbi:hypothetical protein VTN77DRAFT_960 [Rasamsonia byssochlamydoides]|uniref:uncharacterized protein n=1 Tax=Rasamsonia byssochlamydoides TaxID=89139 RepID=UPI0037433661
MANPSLGAFAALPPEIRLLIWDYFYPSGHDTPSARKRNKTDLSILRASRQLYEEISTHLFAHLDYVEFEVSPVYRRGWWIDFYDSWHRSRWTFHDGDDAKARGFLGLPYAEMKIEIHILLLAPDPKDPGQLTCLWQKVNELIRFLQEMDSIGCLTIRLEDTETTAWLDRDKGKPTVSIHEPHDRRLWVDKPYYPNTDFEVVLLPFHCLDNIKEIEIYASDEFEEMPAGSFLTFHDSLVSIAAQIWRKSDYYPRYSSTTTDEDRDANQRDVDEFRCRYVTRLLDWKLNRLGGNTADMLRLERFSRWFAENCVGGYADYEEKKTRAIRRCDPWLSALELDMFSSPVAI